jgi:hypothetical protein
MFTDHAYQKMDVLGETTESVSIAIESTKSFSEQVDGTWRAFGGGLTCVVAVIDDVVVVTLFV